MLVSDFGISKHLGKHATTTLGGDKATKGSYPWMAPECMDGGRHTLKADVYSLGIVIWELLTRKLPFVHLSEDGKTKPDIAQLSIAVAVRKTRPQLADVPKVYPKQIIKLMKQCWDHKPEKRPTLKAVMKALRELPECVADV